MSRRSTRAALLVALLSLLGMAWTGPVSAAPSEPPAPPGRPRDLVAAQLDPPATGVSPVDPAHRIETSRVSRPVAPGVSLSSWDWYEQGEVGGWVRADALSVDLTRGATADYLYPGQVAKAEPLSAQATRNRAVAAVNGDFFDINNSSAPLGAGIQNGTTLKSPAPGRNRAVGIDAAGIGRVMEIFFTGSATLPGDRKVALTQLNSSAIESGGVGVFNPLWGTYARGRAVQGAARVTEVVVRGDVRGDKVTEVRASAGADPIPADGYVLVGREAGADALQGLRPGDAVSVDYGSKTGDGRRLKAAVGGDQMLLKDGEVVAPDHGLHPRTAVGFAKDGKKMFLLTLDGREPPFLLGLDLKDVARMLKELGAYNALNLDGGGSSTMLAREPGTLQVQVENTPSDGAERAVPNGLALYAPRGSGRLKSFWVETAADPRRAPGAGITPGGRPDRVFPGLTRRLSARGYDETYGPAEGTPSWHVLGGGRIDKAGVYRAHRPGNATVVASHGRARGRIGLTVLGDLTRTTPTVQRVSLPGAGATGSFGVVGHDADGFTAPIEPSDVRLEYDQSLVDVKPGEDGTFRVTGKGTGATVIKAYAGGFATAIAVTSGVSQQTIADFDDAAKWTAGSARGTASVAPVSDGHTGGAIRLSYDFSKSTGTRTAYAIPPAPLRIEGQTAALGAWVYGHGRGEWTAFTVTDASGKSQALYGPYITWTGWRYLEIPVPAGLPQPIRVDRFYTIETKADRQYTGEVLIDDMVAKVTPSVTPPAQPVVADPVVVQDGTVAGRRWRFAVMSDAQFVARNPDSDLVRGARRTLREIKARRPDFLVINGDLVDEAAPEDLALAHRILTEELGDELRWYYVPGNHEIMGPGTIDNFRKEFGRTHQVFDHKGTRFVLLDSSTGTVRGGGFDQLAGLRTALDEGAGDRDVRSVVVLEHHPARDPSPAQNSQLSDRREAAVVEQWLTGFERRSGKDAAFVGAHVGMFGAGRVDGVPYLINGNSGKAPATGADQGGFTGWTLLGVGSAWRSGEFLAAEIRPHVDQLDLAAPERLARGASATVRATVTQGTRQVPVAYPVSSDWSGSPGLHIGDPGGARPWHTATFDPRTGTLTGLRAGDITIEVTVNGVTRRATVAVARR